MKYLGYHASLKQFQPSELLSHVRLAENYGFSAISSSDDFFARNEKQLQTYLLCAWLGAALQNSTLPFFMASEHVTSRHTDIFTQAIAALEEIFPTRLSIAHGTGEALNEMSRDKGTPIKQVGAKKTPLLFMAAATEEDAAWAGNFADGLITVAQPRAELQKMVDAFRNNGGENKPMYLKVKLAYEDSFEEALFGADQYWQSHGLHVNAQMAQGLANRSAQIDTLQAADPGENIRISEKLAQHVEWIDEDLELGFEKVFLHQVCKNQIQFIEDFGRSVLPKIDLRWNYL